MDQVALYAHEYGHNIGLGHMMTGDYLQDTQRDEFDLIGRISPVALDRRYTSGFVTTIMNYATGSGSGPDFVPRHLPQFAGLDPINRSKLGWGNVVEVTLTEDDRRAGPHDLARGEQRRVELIEHLGHGPNDSQAQILKVNLPPQRVNLFPQSDVAGNPTAYWRPGPKTDRMVWSGRTFGGTRTMETNLKIPANLDHPVLSFWTKYGGHAAWLYPSGWEFGWVQISTDGGQRWTSLPGQTSSNYVDSYRETFDWFGEDLGAPAFTGDSRQFAANGWILERIPLPVQPGAAVRVRFNFGGYGFVGEIPSQDFGWWIDDISLGTPSDPSRYLVSDFEGEDANRWKGLLTEFDQGIGFVVVEETSSFPQSYFFELRGNNAHDQVAFKELFPKQLNGYIDDATYRYDDGVVGYYANHYATFWAMPWFRAGTATHQSVPVEQLRRANRCYPHCPGIAREEVLDFAGLLATSSDPSSGVSVDDVVFLLTSPHETFSLDVFGQGYAYPIVGDFSRPSAVSILDSTPTYRPQDVTPSIPETPFPERPPYLWPYVIGAPGGWPKTIADGPMGLNDPTTTSVVGQPFLARDAAFHPNRNTRFDDRVDYRGSFVNEFTNWHGSATQAAFASSVPSERLKMIPAEPIPVSESESIQTYFLEYCSQDTSGACVAPAQAVQRSWVEQIVHERLAYMVYLVTIGSCPPRPPFVFTTETKPDWDAYFACRVNAADSSNQQTNQLLDAARNLGSKPQYSWLNSYGNQGTLNPALWTEFYLDAWARAKGPEQLPSFGFSMEVERITNGGPPKATLKLRRSGS
jgi:hypothetical protein